MKQEYARAYAEKPENKKNKKETTVEVSYEIENKDIKDQYTL